jgi:hypothetical protein
MKTKYPSLFGILAALMLVVSFVLPASLISPANVAADPGICKWDTLREPNGLTGTFAIANCTEGISLAVGSDFATVYAVAKFNTVIPLKEIRSNLLLQSAVKGVLWSASRFNALQREVQWTAGDQLFQVVVAPDNPNFVAVSATTGAQKTGWLGPTELWVSQNGGMDWDYTSLHTLLNKQWMYGTTTIPGETIRDFDISPDYGGKRDIAVATTDGLGGGRLFVVKSTGFSGWQDQKVTTATNTSADINLGSVDFFAVKFSPSYASDASLAVVFADAGVISTSCNTTDPGGTWYNVAHRDIDQNATMDWAFGHYNAPATSAAPGIEVKDPTWPVASSPSYKTLNQADLELPSDFSGQAASLRRAYISLDAFVGCGSNCVATAKSDCARDGIFRIDDTTVYTLMDTHSTNDKSIYSIAYFGTYASGKLLAGERMGFPCSATVPTWFTDSPTTCPVPCWYPCLKCPTGAACQPTPCCTIGSHCGVGAAIVAWAPQGNLAYALTSSAVRKTIYSWWTDLYYIEVASLGVKSGNPPVCNDESALSISRNNGETWNQVSLIDTVITKFTDIAPSPDCKTVYVASVYNCSPVTSCTVTVSANLTCSAVNGCNVTYTTPTKDSCGNTIKTFTLTQDTPCSYDLSNCTCTFPSISIAGTVHCACSTCDNCTVNFSASVTDQKVVTNNGTAAFKIVPIIASVDCAIQPGCSTVTSSCCCFDSVWRSSFSADVEAPLSVAPVGTIWERVFTHVTAPDCTFAQTDTAILRLVPYCADPTGEIVAWAVYDPLSTFKHGVAAWSPDYGDYWAIITPRNAVQDFAFESRTIMYFLSPGGLVQKMPYTGTAWSSSLPNADSGMAPAHTIAAYPEGKVLVGAESFFNATTYATSYCGNFNTDAPAFSIQYLAGNTGGGNVHVAFDPAFKDNNTYYIGVDDKDTNGAEHVYAGSVYRNNPAAQLRWQDTNMMADTNGAVGCNAPHAVGQYGIALAFTGSALYSAHTFLSYSNDEHTYTIPCGVDRTIDDGTGKYGPLSGMPKPGIAWDHLQAGFTTVVPCFTLEPSSLKICGCCTLDTDSTLYAIDNANYAPTKGKGLIWAFTDCMAKRGPALVTADKTLIGCDPVSGRASEVNLCWEQLCVADAYDIEIAKDAGFTLKVVDVGNEDCMAIKPVDVTTPCVFFPAGGETAGLNMDNYYQVGESKNLVVSVKGEGSSIGYYGNLECGHTYYWRVKVRECATTQWIRSPWSEARSFNVKAGFPVVTSYQGLSLLAPANGSMGIPAKSPAFSWAPLGETTKYKFQLAKDGALTQIVKEAEVTGTAYSYDGTLDYSTPYFWKVSCVDPACDASATFSFQTEPKPAEAAAAAPVAPTPIWVWVIIAIGAILVIVTLVLIFKTRRV